MSPTGVVHQEGAYTISAELANLLDDSYTRIANVQGAFEFNQKGTTPNDELFNVFGTAILSMCSKPAQELVDAGEGQANFFVNVSGDIQKTFSVDVSELDDEQGVLMGCSCMTGSPFGQAYVVGVPLASVVEMADLEEGVNTVTAYGARRLRSAAAAALRFGEECAARVPGERPGAEIDGRFVPSAVDARDGRPLFHAQYRGHFADARGGRARSAGGGAHLPITRSR